MRIQWYPGHMARTKREIEESLSEVDLVAEVVDARIPISSRNPDLWQLCNRRPWIIVLNRIDQADPQITARWHSFFESQGLHVVETDSKSGKGCNRFIPAVREILSDKIHRLAEKGQAGKSLRIMILGVPNVGKSSFINKVAGRTLAKAEDRPGVTRSRQWVRLDTGIDMLDTPGMLWPKFENPKIGTHLAVTGSVKDDILDLEELCAAFSETLARVCPEGLSLRFKIKEEDFTLAGYDLLCLCAKKRGFLLPGGVADTERCARILLDEYRGGKMGRISLERPEDIESYGVNEDEQGSVDI